MRAAFALSALAATATAAKQSVVSLTADERLTLEQALAEWKAEFGAVARENNLLPTKNSILSEDEQVVAELQRILDSKFSAEQAALTNPGATSSRCSATTSSRNYRHARGRDRVVAGDVQGLDHVWAM
ncbi:hypothetical protein AaE_002416 [Aphanomyces astaci]|uniref:Uncharacterized protein n=1 Tax=Aphanomyces astaci TaxID=112090 RepID=A0A6A5AYX7_APHAT|nr:hypothetical protein AaE_002416 [Aphanomyces astaci]